VQNPVASAVSKASLPLRSIRIGSSYLDLKASTAAMQHKKERPEEISSLRPFE
jgi:hypothetical protein